MWESLSKQVSYVHLVSQRNDLQIFECDLGWMQVSQWDSHWMIYCFLASVGRRRKWTMSNYSEPSSNTDSIIHVKINANGCFVECVKSDYTWSAKHLVVAYKKRRYSLRRLHDVYLRHIYLCNQIGVCVCVCLCVMCHCVNNQLHWHPNFIYAHFTMLHVVWLSALFTLCIELCCLVFLRFPVCDVSFQQQHDNRTWFKHDSEPKKSYETKAFPGKIRILIVLVLNFQHLHCMWRSLMPLLVLIFYFLS